MYWVDGQDYLSNYGSVWQKFDQLCQNLFMFNRRNFKCVSLISLSFISIEKTASSVSNFEIRSISDFVDS